MENSDLRPLKNIDCQVFWKLRLLQNLGCFPKSELTGRTIARPIILTMKTRVKPNQKSIEFNSTNWLNCCSISLVIKHNRTETFTEHSTGYPGTQMGTVYFNRLSNAYQIYNVHLNLLMKWLLGSNHSQFYQIYITNYFLAPNIMQSKFNLL